MSYEHCARTRGHKGPACPIHDALPAGNLKPENHITADVLMIFAKRTEQTTPRCGVEFRRRDWERAAGREPQFAELKIRTQMPPDRRIPGTAFARRVYRGGRLYRVGRCRPGIPR